MRPFLIYRHPESMRQRLVAARSGGFSLIEPLIGPSPSSPHSPGSSCLLRRLPVERNREQDLRIALPELRGAIDNYKKAVDEGCVGKKTSASGYPENLQMLVDDEGDLRDPRHRKIYFLRRIPRDPMHRDASLSSADSWAKRADASEPDSPREGYGVSDVYSKSRGIGLNGVPYGQW